jgi:hypothetical protein
MEACHIERFGSVAHRYLAGLPTPHGEREPWWRATIPTGSRSSNPSWGTGTLLAFTNLSLPDVFQPLMGNGNPDAGAAARKDRGLPTPHGERELVPEEPGYWGSLSSNPSWGTGTQPASRPETPIAHDPQASKAVIRRPTIPDSAPISALPLVGRQAEEYPRP